MGPRDTWDGMARWLKQLGSSVSKVKPKALIVISAHWEEAEFTVNSGSSPNLLYDYYGFPESTYKLEYKAPGYPNLASRIHDLLAERQIKCRLEQGRGFDHGVFVPLKLVYPDADIPIVQVSLKKGLDPADHIAFGKALAPLRSEGVLIIGSGMSYHNLRNFGDINAGRDATAFDTWLANAVCHSDPNTRSRLLSDWTSAPSARAAHPREEHLIPLMVVAGAAGSDAGQQIYSEQIMGAAISGYQFG